MSLYKANRALTDFRRKLFRFVHGSILSKIGASTKPGAVQNHQQRNFVLIAVTQIPNTGDSTRP